MSQLVLLWNLEEQYNNIKKLKEQLDNILNEKETEDLRVKLKQTEYDLTNKKTLLEVNDIKIKRNTHKVEQLNFQLKENEKKLYSGKVSNIDQLSHMQKESERTKEEIQNVENEILELMEDTDNLKKEIEENENKYKSLKKELDETIKKYDILKEELEQKIKEKEKEIKILSGKIEKDLLNKYLKLKEKKGKAIVKISGDRCTGCHMSVPLSIISKLKSKKVIVTCDNCGRILYYEKED
ncbi:zinc ribbon domain-containing protein [Thermohalobacter berrensis]|uniref:Uncharacterized protein n=1 Tax=Thermohalobacter berrensis TaxID=99594 RepID=A0A419TB61_9FIRM|nr:C4-type zinc ribbon domain-containing protein [Thermohalobacter berrensis]RKD34716.1 hypothetical protein BET03_02510 [Thermohalobacter berrensis]